MESGLTKTSLIEESKVEFTNTLRRIQDSVTYGYFCEKVYGRDLKQFNAVDEEQLQHLLQSLRLNGTQHVLDVGCGSGFISEYISDMTGAKVTGVDFAEDIIRDACRRTSSKRERLNFLTADFNSFPETLGKFDYIIALDSLYFVDELPEFIRILKRQLQPHGRLATFFTFKRQIGDLENALDPRTNRLGKALTNAGFYFQTRDFSDNEKIIWENAQHYAEVLKDAFIQEGYVKTYEERIWESDRNLKSINEGRSARHFYLTGSRM